VEKVVEEKLLRWWISLLKLVVVAIMLLTSIVSANEAFEFQGFDAWYLQQKDWVKTDNTLSWPHVSWAEARLGEFQWTDYDLTFTVVPEEYGEPFWLSQQP
jgi:hypothetical protein